MTFPLNESEDHLLTPADGNPMESSSVWVRMRLSVVDDPQDWSRAVALTPNHEDKTSEKAAVSEEEVKRQVREQLTSIIDLIQAQASWNVQTAKPYGEPMSAEDLRSVDELVADPQKFDELIQRIVDEGSSGSAVETVQAKGEPEEGAHFLEAEVSQENQELSANNGRSDTPKIDTRWDFALDLPAFLESRPEVTVYEMQDGRAQLYILCEQGKAAGELYTVTANEAGQLFTGAALDTFAQELVASIPEKSVQWVLDGSGFLDTADFSDGLDQLNLDPAGRCAALVELPMNDLPGYMRPEVMVGEVQAAPADKGWSLIQADSLTLGRLLEAMNVPAIVAEKTFFAQNLSFILPSDSGQSPAEGSVTEWVNRALGTPDTVQVGATLTFSWSTSAKRGAVSPPLESALGDALWSLPGRLPSSHQDIVTGDNLDQLIWLYGLDEQAARRLTNYVMDGSSAEGLESALHALDLPEELLKVIDGSVLLEDCLGYREFSPRMSGLERFKESVTAYPNGTDPMSAVSRQLIQRPWLAAADGFAQLGASGALTLWAARRLAKGQSARSVAVAAAALGASGAAELVLARTYRKLHEDRANLHEPVEAPSLSIIDELQAVQTEQGDRREAQQPAQPPATAVQRAKNWGRKAVSHTRQSVRRYLR